MGPECCISCVTSYLLQFACHWLVVVLDEEDTTITVGSIVTVTVNLVRKDMSVLFDNEIPAIEQIDEDETAIIGNADEDGDEDEDHDERQVLAVVSILHHSGPP